MRDRFERFCAAISGLYRDIQKIERDEMEKYGYKAAFAQYLTVLSHHPEGVTAAQLCELCGKDKAAVSRAVAEMAEKGLIQREGDRPYRAVLTLTPEGRETTKFVLERAELAVELGGKGLSEENRRIFYEALFLIASNVQTISRDGLPAPERNDKEKNV